MRLRHRTTDPLCTRYLPPIGWLGWWKHDRGRGKSCQACTQMPHQGMVAMPQPLAPWQLLALADASAGYCDHGPFDVCRCLAPENRPLFLKTDSQETPVPTVPLSPTPKK